jgi:hypothetical protein
VGVGGKVGRRGKTAGGGLEVGVGRIKVSPRDESGVGVVGGIELGIGVGGAGVMGSVGFMVEVGGKDVAGGSASRVTVGVRTAVVVAAGTMAEAAGVRLGTAATVWPSISSITNESKIILAPVSSRVSRTKPALPLV